MFLFIPLIISSVGNNYIYFYVKDTGVFSLVDRLFNLEIILMYHAFEFLYYIIWFFIIFITKLMVTDYLVWLVQGV